ncbi:MAG: FAD-binding protein [Collinsella sp.]|nr:FAD-binding protein [Collinsella sp.]
MPQADVLVIGSGIAGISAAIEAAREGASVTIASVGPFASGSSFHPATWGLGLIGPENPDDVDDLVSSILHVGRGVADPDLVRTLVEGIDDAVRWLEELGIELKRPKNAESALEREFIPCFDTKRRLWRGLVREALKSGMGREVDRLGIGIEEGVELVDLVQDGRDRIVGAVLHDLAHGELTFWTAGSVVLATGGTGGLFARSLSPNDVLGSAHGIALAHGCRLVNIEFMQMMPGLVWPREGVVFNEKTFRHVSLLDENPILGTLSDDGLKEVLEQRSGHGPFTASLDDHVIDLAIDASGPSGLPLRYDLPPIGNRPEFVQSFITWLETEHEISPDDEMRLAMYAHASNGGIAIDGNGRTGVAGLHACGEVTGGMHGADRIGGLSSANGLVFGRRAGRDAARESSLVRSRDLDVDVMARAKERIALGIDPLVARGALEELRRLMTEHCMIMRTESGLTRARKGILSLRHRIGKSVIKDPRGSEAAALMRISSQLGLAEAMIDAMTARTKGLGAHFRADEPGAQG